MHILIMNPAYGYQGLLQVTTILKYLHEKYVIWNKNNDFIHHVTMIKIQAISPKIQNLKTLLAISLKI